MGRNKKKTTWAEKRKNKKVKTDTYSDAFQDFKYQNKFFESYYRMQFKSYFVDDEQSFQKFMAVLKERLPVTFRINKNVPNYQVFLQKLQDPEFLKAFSKKISEAKELKAQAKKAGGQEQTEEKDNGNKEQNQIDEEKEEEKEDVQEEVSEEDSNSKTPLENIEIKDSDALALKPINWYPDELVWELTLHRQELKRNKIYQGLHKYLQQGTEAGIISRQELVSMIPPLLLDIQSTDLVFDMCAAPGSKTAQILEMLYNDESLGKGVTQGGVVANDVDYTRAYMLTHQIQRISNCGMMVTNHMAQNFPQLHKPDVNKDTQQDSKFYFDKILADVPCSGDAAIRKLPQRWADWTTGDGMGLHGLQVNILLRGLQLVKVGGLLVYSTCSLNPIEDEAVVTEVLRKVCDGCIELLDIPSRIPKLKAQRGLTQWSVCEDISKINKQRERQGVPKEEVDEHETDLNKLFRFYKNQEEVKQANYHSLISPSMFPESEEVMREKFKLQNTIRVLPHEQNTSGFYLALFRKNGPIVLRGKQGQKVEEETKQGEEAGMKKSEDENQVVEDEAEKERQRQAEEIIKQLNQAEEKVVGEQEIATQKIEKGFKTFLNKKDKPEQFSFINDNDFNWIKEYYGITEDFDKNLLMQPKGTDRKVLLISPAIQQMIRADTKNLINKINVGSKAFAKNKEKFADNSCALRICQDSIMTIINYITKRKVYCTVQDLQSFIYSHNIKHEEIENPALQEEVREQGQGSFILCVVKEKGENMQQQKIMDCIVCQGFKTSVCIMCSKEDLHSFRIRYGDSA